MSEGYSGVQKAAILLIALGPEKAATIFKHLKEEEIAPEISVESLLESTAEVQDSLEDIGYNEKSDVRLMIEKFVDENPDAVASLLRNWLNEDWE